MSSIYQHTYASSLLSVQSYGYPLRIPSPEEKNDSEGLQIGDVGYITDYGEFHRVFNTKCPPEKLEGRNEKFPLDQPFGKGAFNAEEVLKAGVTQITKEPRADYAFTMTSRKGAILILPNGATRFELEDKMQLDKIREYVQRNAHEWCEFTKQDTLYLVTAVFKSTSWILGSFYSGSHGQEILVHRPSCDSSSSDGTGSSTYRWVCGTTVDRPVPPENNFVPNQTVLIKGFKMTVRWGLPMIQPAETTKSWFTCFLDSLWSTISRSWLPRIIISKVPTADFSQPTHPLELINRFLLDKNPGAEVAVTHDNDWIKMLERGLSPTHLFEENHLQKFMMEEHIWDLDTEHDAVYLRNILEDAPGEHEPAQDPSSLSRSDNPRPAIINMRLESADIHHIYAGVCVIVQFGSTLKRTKNKPHAGVVEWDDEVILPPSGLCVSVTVCGVFQLGSTLETRNIFTEQAIDPEVLSGDTHMIRFSLGKAESYSSLLITLGRHFSHFETLSRHEEKSDFVEKTNVGLKALYSYHDDPKEEDLGRALGSFQSALEQCGDACRATALFNLATSKFIWCQAHGTYAELNGLIELYEEALKLRDSDHPDRPATILLFSQALLSRLGQEYDESTATRIRHLLAEIHPGDSRDRRTADAIIRTCRFYQAVHPMNPTEVDDSFFRDLDRDAYVPPYGYFDKPRTLYILAIAFLERFKRYANLGDLDKSITLNEEALRLIPDRYFDRPRMLHKLAVALWERFQRCSNLDDLNKSIELNEKALPLIPDEHDDRASIVACLGKSFLRRIEACGDLMDVDMSADLVALGDSVIAALDSMPSIEGAEVSTEGGGLREQIAMMSAADTALQYIEEEVPPPRIPVIQSLIDEWTNDDGIPARCKRQLGVLLSFLGGEGETKMRELLEQPTKVDWPFKAYKIEETMKALQNCMPYFQIPFATRLGT